MLTRRLARVSCLAGAIGLLVGMLSRDAFAGWPPVAGDDLSNPSSWPNDPGYADLWNYFSYLPAQASGTPPYSAPDLALGASGMSIDKAWESSAGSSLVRIAVVDSGILWEEADLVQQVYLNAAELTGAHMPRTAAGLTCAGTNGLKGYDCNGDGVFTVSDYAEDPRLTPLVVGDPCTNPSTGVSQPNRIAGDLNHNCVLDAGDLIELFGDGIDDDENGYIDDIAGWDFFKNDNNPYDDTRNGHGTTVALQAAAEGNNGIESIGACPRCRVLVLRVGNSTVADSNDVAKALVYAADNLAPAGASVAALATNAVNLTGFGRAAIDYAYSKNVVVVAGMGDDNSREHGYPATYNHTLPVHGIGENGASLTASSSFLDYVNCGSFGGQLALSASAAGCSDEATARTAGIAGLIFAWAEARSLSPSLTADEVMAILRTSADVVNVPSSRSASNASTYYESLPGFSQRFGYGRVNASRALEAVATGNIPAEIDLRSPTWFTTVYPSNPNETSGLVPLLGRVVAARAPSYDVTVAWAPGVEPLDSEFTPLAPTVSNVPGQTVTGGESPLALIDPTTLNTAHLADPDSPQHENDRTITLRVQAVAHYAAGDVTSEVRRSIAIVNAQNGTDPDLLPGFPLQLSGSIEGGAKLVDISGDGVRDIVVATNDGYLHVFSVGTGIPTEIDGFPYLLLPADGLDPTSPVPAVPNYLTAPAYAAGVSGGISAAVTRESVDATVAVGAVTGDGTQCIVFVSWAGTVYVVDDHGANVPGWPQRLPLVPSCPDNPATPATPGDCMDTAHDLARGAYASPVLADFDNDGTVDILIAGFDGNLYVFHGDGTLVSGFPTRVHAAGAFREARIMSTPAVADLNGDGIPDILVGTNETVGQNGNTGFYFVIDGRGTLAPAGSVFPNWPIEIPSLYSSPVVGEGTTASPVLASFGGGAALDAVLQGNGSSPWVIPAAPGVQTGDQAPASRLPTATLTGGASGFAPLDQFGAGSLATADTMLPLFSHPSVGDLDQDGVPDVVMAGGGQSILDNLKATTALPFQQMLAMWSGKTGAMMPGAPVVLEDFSRLTSQAIADISGDGYPEVIAGTGGYFVHAVDACGRETSGWPKLTGGWTMGSPAVGDITGSQQLDVVVGTREGFLFAWSTAGAAGANGVVEWESFHHDSGNTGNYATALTQGGGKAATTLLCGSAAASDTSTVATAEVASAAAGCGCRVASGRDERTGIAGLAIGWIAWVRARRARRGKRG